MLSVFWILILNLSDRIHLTLLEEGGTDTGRGNGGNTQGLTDIEGTGGTDTGGTDTGGQTQW